jgi:hypothetical protein
MGDHPKEHFEQRTRDRTYKDAHSHRQIDLLVFNKGFYLQEQLGLAYMLIPDYIDIEIP